MPDEEGPALFKLHLEPDEPIGVYELTGALGSLAHQYEVFIRDRAWTPTPSKARLLISSVSPGSIDINFLPDWAAAVPFFAPFLSDMTVVTEFAGHIKDLLDRFWPGKEKSGKIESSIRDCDDAINIVKPIASHGGTQQFNIFNGPVNLNIVTLDSQDARRITEEAARERAKLQSPNAERKERVSMVWKRLDRDAVKSEGSTPDKALIEEIDPRPKPVLFADDLSYLKREMIEDEANPYQKVYFVDVEVSRVSGKVTAYRVSGYHGKDDLDVDENTSSGRDLLS